MVQIQVDKKSTCPLYAQIRDGLQAAISRGELRQGDRLPTVAALAGQAGVTQATIRRALEDLTREGLVHSHVGRGTFVGPVPGISAPGGPAEESGGKRPPVASARAARRLRQGISKGLCDLMAAAGRPGGRDFSKGVPDPGLMAAGLWEKMVGQALQEAGPEAMTYGDLGGLPGLREAIAGRYGAKGVHISPDQVLITIGAQQGICIAALDAAEQHRRVLVETPGFQGAMDAFVSHGNPVETFSPGDNLQAVSGGDDPGQTTLVSLCPDFQNPTGETMDNARRRSIADWAGQNNGLILSDVIYQDLRFEGRAPEPMINFLGQNRIVVVSSLSKSLAPGLRVGWMVSSPERIAEFRRLKRLMAQTGPPLMQSVALAFLTSGAYDEHLERVRGIYRDRRDVMVSCLSQLMPDGVSWTCPQGGFALWVTLPPGYSSVALLISVLDKGISLVPGPIFDRDQRFVNAFRLSWAWTGKEEIVEGIEILADAVKELLRRPPGDSGLSGLGQF